MIRKTILFLLLTACAMKGQTISLLALPDTNVTHTPNSLLGTSMGIAKSFEDTLQLCMVTFPNKFVYEAYPRNQLPPSVSFEDAHSMFRSCVIGFRDIGHEMAGPYLLESLVYHTNNRSRTLVSQRFNLILLDME
ncbi:hypothetical protein ACJJTC_001639 [Scirpophaga incertulas]